MAAAMRGIPYNVLLGLLLAAQLAFSSLSHKELPDMTVVPTPPGKQALDVLSFGDNEFLFRSMAFLLGNAGDTFGRNTPLYQYDMKKLYTWFTLLDQYNDQSVLLPTLSANYFSQTQKTKDVRYLVDYLSEHGMRNISRDWWWITSAVYLALHKLEDTELALKVAEPLSKAPDIPVWAQQMPALVHEKRGEFGDAAYIIENILSNVKEIPENELVYMNYFLQERLGKLEELEKKNAAAAKRLKKSLDAPSPAE